MVAPIRAILRKLAGLLFFETLWGRGDMSEVKLKLRVILLNEHSNGKSAIGCSSVRPRDTGKLLIDGPKPTLPVIAASSDMCGAALTSFLNTDFNGLQFTVVLAA
jgi:hypothetical protein